MRARIKLRIAIAAILLIAVIFLPQIISVAWHIRHGRTVTYRSWEVAVPFGWYARSHGDGMSVERMSEIPWKNGPAAEFLPVHFAKMYPFSYTIFAKEQAATLRAMGYLPVDQRDVKVAGESGRCWTFDNWKKHDQFWIACIVPKDFTSADFIGSKGYANAFFSLLAQSKRNPAAKD